LTFLEDDIWQSKPRGAKTLLLDERHRPQIEAAIRSDAPAYMGIPIRFVASLPGDGIYWLTTSDS
jgi:hypothetical protein